MRNVVDEPQIDLESSGLHTVAAGDQRVSVNRNILIMQSIAWKHLRLTSSFVLVVCPSAIDCCGGGGEGERSKLRLCKFGDYRRRVRRSQ